MAAVLRALVRLTVVFAVMAAGLRVFDAVPRAVTGLPRGVERVASIEELEARSGARFPLPSYVPAHLEWPAHEFTWDGHTAALTARQRDSGAPWLAIALTHGAARVPPAAILPTVDLLQESETAVAGVPAHVQRVQDRSGAMWHQATWSSGGYHFAIRYRGSVEDLLFIAVSFRTGNHP
jgi:hypothetical protein